MTRRCFKNFDNNAFISEVRKIKMYRIYECEDVEDAVQKLSDEICKILDEMAPVRTIQVREKYAPWLSSEVKNLMCERDKAQRVASSTNSEEDWTSFKKLRNQVNNMLKSAKNKWQRSKLQKMEEEGDAKQIWKNVKSSLNWTSSGAPSQLFHNGRLENKPSGLAECMNHFFSSIK